MPPVARGNGTEPVATPHGAGKGCNSPTTQATAACSGDVFVNGIGVVREGDAMKTHPAPGCSPHAPGLSSFSGTVKVNGKGLGRQGDEYAGHTISAGSGNVNAG